jgi:DNA-binding response OmpR family regulator
MLVFRMIGDIKHMTKILVVDDDSSVSELIKTVLEENGFTVILASSAEKAKEIIGTENPQLALIDIMLPGQGGMDLILDLHGLWPNLGIILTSGKIDMNKSAFRVLARQFGVLFVLPKPFRVEELLETVRDAEKATGRASE